MGFWALAWCLDIVSTYRLFVRDPAGFPRLERNVFLSSFVPKYGFWRSVAACLFIAELPILLLIVLGPMAALSALLLGPVGLTPALSASAVLLGIFHLHAACVNYLATNDGGLFLMVI